MSLVFMGTPEWAIPSLKALIDSDIKICAVFTQPDRRTSRGKKLIPSPIKQYAEKKRIKVFTTEITGSKKTLEILNSLNPEIVLVCAYGQILNKEILEIPKIGCFNLHFSFLPKLRGASPVQTAILLGFEKTGVCLQKMIFRLDAGPLVASSKPIKIKPNETTPMLGNRLAEIGGELISVNLPKLIDGSFTRTEQNEKDATYCNVIKKQEGQIKWDKESASEIERKSRAFEPWPGIFSFYCPNSNTDISRRIQFTKVEVVEGNFEPGKIYQDFIVGTISGGLKILKLKPEGKNEMDSYSFLLGNSFVLGKFLKRY